MKIKLLFFILPALFISCNNTDIKKARTLTVDNVTNSKYNDLGFNELNFEDFKNSKWIIGESGVNGEKPDTIIFVEPTKLVYVSTDTGRSTRNYSFSKDTLIYTYSEIEFDLDLDKEVTFEVTDKLLYKDNRFFYITSRKKNSVTSSSKTDNLAHLNLFFRKVE